MPQPADLELLRGGDGGGGWAPKPPPPRGTGGGGGGGGDGGSGREGRTFSPCSMQTESMAALS